MSDPTLPMAMVKQQAQRLVDLLDEYAGSMSKPPQVKAEVSAIIIYFEETLPKIISALGLQHLATGVFWKELFDAYANGSGQWTICLPLAQKLNKSVQQL